MRRGRNGKNRRENGEGEADISYDKSGGCKKAFWRAAARWLRPAFRRLGSLFRIVGRSDINACFDMDNKNFKPDSVDKPCFPPDKCSKTGFEIAEVSLPLEILPNTCVGEVETDCCGEPNVSCECEPCGNTCRLVITQRIKIKIPFTIGIKAVTGCSHISCAAPGRCGCADDCKE